jgi:hypothetical protein
MAQVNKEFVLNKVEETGYPYFIIWELDNKTRLFQNIDDKEANVTKTRQVLEEFFNATEGTIIVQLQAFDNMQGKATNQMLKIQTRLTSGNQPTMQQNINGPHGTDIERILNLQAENHRQAIEHIREQHKRDLEMMDIKRELEAQKNSNFLEKHGETLINGLAPYLFPQLLKSAAAAAPIINGAPKNVEVTTTEAENKLEQLLKRWHAIEPNFIDHIEIMVNLAENNPIMYNQGLSIITTL